VVERTPILLWSQGENITWIDANGISFMPRGNVPGLIPIASNGNPPNVAPPDLKQSVYNQPFISPDMVQAIVTLYPQVPDGSPMIFDPKYGMGWQDPRGWSVYFGQNTQDIPMKLKVYQAILDTITKQGVQPTLISVEYLDAPFYK
jgi:cell division protein FtsQ